MLSVATVITVPTTSHRRRYSPKVAVSRQRTRTIGRKNFIALSQAWITPIDNARRVRRRNETALAAAVTAPARRSSRTERGPAAAGVMAFEPCAARGRLRAPVPGLGEKPLDLLCGIREAPRNTNPTAASTLATVGTPRAQACRKVFGMPSYSEVLTSTRARSNQGSTSASGRNPVTSRFGTRAASARMRS